MTDREYPDTYLATYSVRETSGKWAVYLNGARVSPFYPTRMDATFLGVRRAEARGK